MTSDMELDNIDSTVFDSIEIIDMLSDSGAQKIDGLNAEVINNFLDGSDSDILAIVGGSNDTVNLSSDGSWDKSEDTSTNPNDVADTTTEGYTYTDTVHDVSVWIQTSVDVTLDGNNW